MNSTWEKDYQRDRADEVIADLIRINRRGWAHFDVAELVDLPRRFSAADRGAPSADEIRAQLGQFLLSARARKLGPPRFQEWDDESRFAVKLFGVHRATRDVSSIVKRRELAMGELRESRATQPQAIQKRPWRDQPLGGPEWRLLLRVRNDVKARFPDPPPAEQSSQPPAPAPAVEAPRLDSFVGRAAEVAEVREAIGAGVRLVSIVGPGGVGKTRLALETMHAYPDDPSAFAAFSARLEDVSPDAALEEAVARQLGLVREGRETWLDVLVSKLGNPQSGLLLLDNCEHLIAACADLASSILAGCPQVRLLVTSREPLSVRGEKVIRLRGLATAAVEGGSTEDDATERHAPAVELFLDRARARVMDLDLTDEDAATVAELAERVGGLPLALEIAAAWVDRLSIGEIASGLRGELRELPNPLRDSPRRHQTIEACLDWSYGLLQDEEQRALRWVSEFVGGWDASVPEVFDDQAAFEGGFGDALDRLVECSLVERRTGARGSRYGMVDLVREFARERLCEAGELEAARAAHRQWCLALAAETHDRFGGLGAERWLPRIDADLPNLRAAIKHAVADSDFEAVLGFAELWWYWFLRGLWGEVRPSLEAALDSGAGSAGARTQGLLAAGTLAWAAGDLPAARSWLGDARTAGESQDDTWCLAQVAHIEGHVAQYGGDLPRAKARFDAALSYWEDHPDSYWLALLQDDVGTVLSDLGKPEEARAALIEALAVARAVNDRQGAGNALSHLAVVERRLGSREMALACACDAEEILRKLGYKRGLATALRNLAEVRTELEDLDGADAAVAEATTIQNAIGHDAGLARSLVTRGKVALARGEEGRAAELVEEARFLREAIGAVVSPADREEEERAFASLSRS
jgi:predicted ATPase